MKRPQEKSSSTFPPCKGLFLVAFSSRHGWYILATHTKTANQRYSQHEGGTIDAPFWKSSWWILVEFLGSEPKAEKFSKMSPREKWGNLSVGSTPPRTNGVAENGPNRPQERKRCHLPSIDFRDPFGVSLQGGYSNDWFFFFDLHVFSRATRLRERHLMETANHYSACSLCVKFEHLPQARVENTHKKTSTKQ